LSDAGWRRHQETWNNASIWSNADGREVLVPPSDDLADTDLRVTEILSALTAAEDRPADEIVTDINTPFDDIQLYRTFPDGDLISLAAELQMLGSVRDLIGAAARTVVEGPLPIFPRGAQGPAGQLLQQIRLGPGSRSGHLLTVRIPLTGSAESSDHGPGSAAGEALLGRRVGARLRAAVIAAQAAAARVAGPGDVNAFDEAVAAGVSANLCEALSRLAGHQHAQPFEIAFRWGRGLPSDVPAEAVRFPRGTGTIIRAGAARLRQLGSLGISGAATITGWVESLHGRSPDTGWRINVHGDMRTGGDVESGRTARVRLDSQTAYDRAITAHRSQRRVRARGELSGSVGRTELIVSDDNFEILEKDA
jgi:hypothetical protein